MQRLYPQLPLGLHLFLRQLKTTHHHLLDAAHRHRLLHHARVYGFLGRRCVY